MWFKNLIIYRFNGPASLTAEQLEEKLSQQRFRTCGKTELLTLGWVPPIPEGSALVHESNECLLFSACQEERLLPAAVVREAVEEKVSEIQAEQDRKVFRKEKEQLKEEITLTLLPQAFTQRKIFHAYIDTQQGWLIINASSFTMAEKLTSALRKCLGSLPISFLDTQDMPAMMMTHWLKKSGALPPTLLLGDECELAEPGEGGSIIRSKRQELASDEMIQHLESGKVVNKLGIQWKEYLSCIIHSDLCIKRLKFFDALKEQSEGCESDDSALQADADFTLMVLTLRQFLIDIIHAFGELVVLSEGTYQTVSHTEIGTEEKQVTDEVH